MPLAGIFVVSNDSVRRKSQGKRKFGCRSPTKTWSCFLT